MTTTEMAEKYLQIYPLSEMTKEIIRSLLTEHRLMLEALECLAKYSSIGEECGCLCIAREAVERVRKG